jgi:hypothetical protein
MSQKGRKHIHINQIKSNPSSAKIKNRSSPVRSYQRRTEKKNKKKKKWLVSSSGRSCYRCIDGVSLFIASVGISVLSRVVVPGVRKSLPTPMFYLSRVRLVHEGDLASYSCPFKFSLDWLFVFLLLKFFPLQQLVYKS